MKGWLHSCHLSCSNVNVKEMGESKVFFFLLTGWSVLHFKEEKLISEKKTQIVCSNNILVCIGNSFLNVKSVEKTKRGKQSLIFS